MSDNGLVSKHYNVTTINEIKQCPCKISVNASAQLWKPEFNLSQYKIICWETERHGKRSCWDWPLPHPLLDLSSSFWPWEPWAHFCRQTDPQSPALCPWSHSDKTGSSDRQSPGWGEKINIRHKNIWLAYFYNHDPTWAPYVGINSKTFTLHGLK